MAKDAELLADWRISGWDVLPDHPFAFKASGLLNGLLGFAGHDEGQHIELRQIKARQEGPAR